MELLVLGGTSFAGRHVVERALAEGHTVTTFNRGRTNPELFPTCDPLHGDRTSGDYAALKGAGPFDAVVDMCAYVPRAVREAVAALGPAGLAGPYILVSSVSAYAEPQAHAEPARASPRRRRWRRCPTGIDPASEDVTGETYGPLKVLTEAGRRGAAPRRGHDHPARASSSAPTTRPTGSPTGSGAWPTAARSSLPRAPTSPGRRSSTPPTWPAGSSPRPPPAAPAPTTPLRRRSRSPGCWRLAARQRRSQETATAGPEPHRLGAVGVPRSAKASQPWTDLPAWVPAPMAALLPADGSKAAAAGLDSRPIEAVVGDLAAWDGARPQEPLRAGHDPGAGSGAAQEVPGWEFRQGAPPPGP